MQSAIPLKSWTKASGAMRTSDYSIKLGGIFLLALALLCPARVRGQQTPSNLAPSNLVGRIEGPDVSVQGSSASGNDNETITPNMLVMGGSVVTVHSGHARMMLESGGEVDICGPAKFTLLQSGGAITLALDFGTMRVRLPKTTSLRIFTPAIVATPLDINGGARDVTVGLDLNDSLCVLAASGAIQLEHQFTAEKLIVPQSGEFFLNAGKLLPVVGKAGSCQCVATMKPQVTAQPPEFAVNGQPLPIVPDAAKNPPADVAPPRDAEAPSVEFSIPAHANEQHPVRTENNNAAQSVAPAEIPVYTVVAPLAFSAASPAPPPDPPIDTILLVRQAQVQPAWEFQGHVDPPNFAAAMQHALGENPTPKETPAAAPKKQRGLWAAMKRIFGGDGAQKAGVH
jgi:hypothetical protein